MSGSAAETQPAGQEYSKGRREVLVIIPAYNEEENIGEVVAGVTHSASFADILVINDGSTDNTATAARRYGASALNLPYNLGHRWRCRGRIRVSRGDGL